MRPVLLVPCQLFPRPQAILLSAPVLFGTIFGVLLGALGCDFEEFGCILLGFLVVTLIIYFTALHFIGFRGYLWILPGPRIDVTYVASWIISASICLGCLIFVQHGNKYRDIEATWADKENASLADLNRARERWGGDPKFFKRGRLKTEFYPWTEWFSIAVMAGMLLMWLFSIEVNEAAVKAALEADLARSKAAARQQLQLWNR